MISKIASQSHEDNPTSEITDPFTSQSSNDLSHTLSLLESMQRSLSVIQKDLLAKSSRSTHSSFAIDETSFQTHSPAITAREPSSRYAQQIQFLQDQIADLKSELAFLKSKVRQTNPTSRALCSGPSFLIACLLAISLFAITVIIFASLGLAGVLPQIGVLMVSHANMLWAVVSASIVTTICLTSVCSVFFIKQTTR